MPLTYVFILVGTAIGLVRGLPQLIRLFRSRNPHGVSVDSAATTGIVSFAWASYGALTDQIAVFVASASTGLVFTAIAVGAVLFGRTVRELRVAPLWLVSLLAAAFVRQAAGLGLALSFSVLIANGPQVRVAWRERDLSGLSLGTWMLSMLEGIAWGSYGFVANDRAILTNGVLQLATSGMIVTLGILKRKAARAQQVE